jgi:hypothetical protein
VTAFSPYQPYPGPAPALTGPPLVHVAVAEPAPQRRVTVAFRILLALPHLFILYWLVVAAEVAAFIGWWGALFTGRLPEFAGTFLSGVARWTTRVYAYCFLLTDVYPPFNLDDDPTYPVRVAIPEPQPLNRAAVFFRYFLAIPASLLGGILIYGAFTLMAFIAWLITLVAGQLPPSFHLAYVAVIRFQTRYYCYFAMLTPAYPGGLYGDEPGAVAWADELPAAPGFGPPGFGPPGQGYGIPGLAYGYPADNPPQGYASPPGYGSPQGGYGAPPGYGTPQGGYGAPQGYDPAQSYGAPQGYGSQGYGAPDHGWQLGYGAPAPGYGAPAPYGAPGGYGVRRLFQPATWLLPLTSAAKALVTTFIVLGSVFLVGYIGLYILSIYALVNSTSTTLNTVNNSITTARQLDTDYTALSNGLHTWETATKSCDNNLTCITKQDTTAANLFTTLSTQLAGMPVPSGSEAAKVKVQADVSAAAQDFTQLSRATTVSQYQAAIQSTGLKKLLDKFDTDYDLLVESVSRS